MAANKSFSLIHFICDLQELTPEEAIGEIASSGLSDSEIATCVKQITFNDTFKFKNQ